jgi:hypothetical protein
MKAVRYDVPLDQIPVDFFADPDGEWCLETLARISGFEIDQGMAVGALTRCFQGHPEGAAVVTLNAKDRPYVVIVECEASSLAPIAQSA